MLGVPSARKSSVEPAEQVTALCRRDEAHTRHQLFAEGVHQPMKLLCPFFPELLRAKQNLKKKLKNKKIN